MNRRIEVRVFFPTAPIPGVLLEKSASEIYWITIHPQEWLVAGTLQIFDGFDAAGKLVWEGRPGQERHCNFIPPIRCEQGIFVLTSVALQAQQIHCFAIGWRSLKWDRPRTHPLDVIEGSKEEVPV